MIQDEYLDLVTGYLEGTASDIDRIQLQALIDAGKIDVLDLVEMERIYRTCCDFDTPDPGQRVHDRFYSMLDNEQRKMNSLKPGNSMSVAGVRISQIWMQIAAAAAILVLGLLMGDRFTPFSNQESKIDHLSAEVAQMREILMISLLQNESPVERLRAVNISQQIPTTESRLVEALLNTLNFDANVNVRVAAVNALIERGYDPDVRKGLIESIPKQNSPLVQIALADAMLILQEPQAVSHFENLLVNSNDMDSGVRSKLENTILALK